MTYYIVETRAERDGQFGPWSIPPFNDILHTSYAAARRAAEGVVKVWKLKPHNVRVVSAVVQSKTPLELPFGG